MNVIYTKISPSRSKHSATRANIKGVPFLPFPIEPMPITRAPTAAKNVAIMRISNGCIEERFTVISSGLEGVC